MPKLKELRCQGTNNKGKVCSQLLYKYEVSDNEFVIEVKCGSCNSFTILRLPFKNKEKNDEK